MGRLRSVALGRIHKRRGRNMNSIGYCGMENGKSYIPISQEEVLRICSRNHLRIHPIWTPFHAIFPQSREIIARACDVTNERRLPEACGKTYVWHLCCGEEICGVAISSFYKTFRFIAQMRGLTTQETS